MITAAPDQEKINDTSLWSEVVRACRRICVLRATGHGVEAARVQSCDLPRALALAGADEADPVIAARLSVVFSAEEERVANAAVLAELIGPILAERLQFLASNPAPARSGVPAEAVNGAEPPPPHRPHPAAPGIADFIEEMLVQERATSRPAPARRAS